MPQKKQIRIYWWWCITIYWMNIIFWCNVLDCELIHTYKYICMYVFMFVCLCVERDLKFLCVGYASLNPLLNDRSLFLLHIFLNNLFHTNAQLRILLHNSIYSLLSEYHSHSEKGTAFIYQNPLPWAVYNTRSAFKQSLKGLNFEVSFF